MFTIYNMLPCTSCRLIKHFAHLLLAPSLVTQSHVLPLCLGHHNILYSGHFMSYDCHKTFSVLCTHFQNSKCAFI